MRHTLATPIPVFRLNVPYRLQIAPFHKSTEKTGREKPLASGTSEIEFTATIYQILQLRK